MEVDTKIISMYENIGYLGMYGSDVGLTILIFAITLGIISFSSYQSVLNQLRTNWNTNKCNPIVMPFAGLIMPTPGQTASETTFENFNYCIQQDMSSVFNIIMMPLEFILYLTITFLDTVLEAIMAVINEINTIKSMMSVIFQELYNKILNFVIPVIEIVVHVRDMLGKINGIITTSLFMIMNIYNITVSGVINILTILVDLLIIIIALLVVMMGSVSTMMANPLTMVPAAALEVIITATLVGLVLPAIIICKIMHSSIKEVFKQNSPDAPKPP
jgi:hypothetical protein